MAVHNGLRKAGTKPQTTAKQVMQQTVNRYGIQNGHNPYKVSDDTTVVIHKTHIGGSWVTYIGLYGTYQATIGKHNTVGKLREASDIDANFIKATYL